MPKIVDKVEITKDELRAWQLRHKGLTLKQIAKKMKKGTTSISRYIKSYEIKAQLPDKIDVDEEKTLQILEDLAWLTLTDCLTATTTTVVGTHPDYKTRLNASKMILNGRGKLIEKSEVNHKGKVTTEIGVTEVAGELVSNLTDAIGGISNAKK